MKSPQNPSEKSSAKSSSTRSNCAGNAPRRELIRQHNRPMSVMHKHEVVIYWSDADQLFLSEAPELPGCIAHGDSHQGALANVLHAMELWIAVAEEFGDLVPQPKARD